MADDQRDVWEEVLFNCPDCGEPIPDYDSRGIEYTDGDIAHGIISCDECSFRARETWGLIETEREQRDAGETDD